MVANFISLTLHTFSVHKKPGNLSFVHANLFEEWEKVSEERQQGEEEADIAEAGIRLEDGDKTDEGCR